MKSLIYLSAIAITAATVLNACSGGDRHATDVLEFGPESTEEVAATTPTTEPATDASADTTIPAIAVKTNHVGNLREVFNDSNYVHLAEAQRIGIEPLGTTRSFWHIRRPLVKVATCEDFVIDSLTHSRPYLIPEGAEMLHEIGRRFRDSLKARDAGDYRIKVTSVLRTPDGVRRLRRVNRNAVDSSVHQMGTTVDITYAQFVPVEGTRQITTESLKGVLAEVLYAMRQEGKIYVKYEMKQPCFHITVRQNP